MVSSTFEDVVEHRKAAVEVLLRLDLFPIGMEFDSAKAGKNVIDSSFEFVDKAHVYVGIVSHRVGGVPCDATRNPDELSITELEYRRALERKIPVYMFLMSDEHAVKKDGVEIVEANRVKLEALKDDATSRSICPRFSSVEELRTLVLQSMAEFKLEQESAAVAEAATALQEYDEPAEVKAPDLLALPRYIPGHDFVGRRPEFKVLDSWAKGDQPVMVVEAIVGEGKSMLAWQWLNDRAGAVRGDLAGVLW